MLFPLRKDQAPTDAARSIPPIDTQVPAGLETATFAAG